MQKKNFQFILFCLAYVSPEVLNPNQASYSGCLSDSWSLGIVLFTLLVGRYPFHHHSISTMFAKISRAKFQIPPTYGISLDAKILLRSLIRLKPEERLLPSDILAHNWLKSNSSKNEYRPISTSSAQSNSISNYVNNFNSLWLLSNKPQNEVNNGLPVSTIHPLQSSFLSANQRASKLNISESRWPSTIISQSNDLQMVPEITENAKTNTNHNINYATNSNK
jgi:serine/threonine protein kinase